MKNGLLICAVCLALTLKIDPANAEEGKSTSPVLDPNLIHLISTEMKGGLFEKEQDHYIGVYPSFFNEASFLSRVSLDYQMVPWARAVKKVEGSEQFLIFPFTRTPDRENKFSWVARLIEESTCFASTGVSPNSLDDAKKRKRILAWLGSSYQTYLENMGFKNLIILHDTEQAVRILNSDPEAAFYYPCDSAQSFLDSTKSKIALNLGAPVASDELWLAGSKLFKHTDATNRFFQEIATLEKNKMLNKLMEKLGK